MAFSLGTRRIRLLLIVSLLPKINFLLRIYQFFVTTFGVVVSLIVVKILKKVAQIVAFVFYALLLALAFWLARFFALIVYSLASKGEFVLALLN